MKVMLQPNFHPFPELRTERLLLRRISLNDSNVIFFLRSDDLVMRYIDKEKAETVEDAKEFIRQVDADIDANAVIMWGIAMQEEPGSLIGNICLWQLSVQNHRAELGYVLHPSYWRRGIMKESIRKVIEYSFQVLGLHSIEARINPDNIASAAVLESSGFIKEAHFREDFYFRGKFLDTLIYSRLVTD